MTLISMLLALIIGRLAVSSDAWQARPYCQAYLKLTAGSGMSKLAEHAIGRYLWILLPGLVVALLLLLVDNRLVTLVVNTLVLLVGIGCWHYRQLYKQYLNALDRGDDEAAFLAMQQIRVDSRSTVDDSNGLLLVWLNFRYYAAVVFWFLLLGAFGVITYALLRHLNEQTALVQTAAASNAAEPLAETETADAAAAEAPILAESAEQEPAFAQGEDAVFAESKPVVAGKDAVHYLLHWADFFPARLFGLGFALVGYFSRASNALLGYFLDFTANNQQVVTDVAKAAEPIIESPLQVPDDTNAMVQLAKRNMLFFLAFTAILTLSGWLG
ncbi:regulatory signaling modulator protein AmpE [Alishewanella longhuensis]